MNILIIGSGGREHALTWKIAQSPLVSKIYCAPGNPGMAFRGECVDLSVNDISGVVNFAKEHDIALTIVGPEDPLANGMVDALTTEGLKAFGPCKAAAQLEASKGFAKDFMKRHNIPTAAYGEFTDAESAISYVREQGAPIVVKADGLAAGKGVTVAQTVEEAESAIQEIMVDQVFGEAGAKLIVEAFLEGEEASIFALSDGKNYQILASSQDHKAAYDGDTGPNTGGMGAYSPAPLVTDVIMKEIESQVIRPCIEGMALDGTPYTGVLYAGLMIGPKGSSVVEFNCRFGDPETQVVLPRMKSDLLPLLLACSEGTLDEQQIEWNEGACVTVVMASGGYPKDYEKGKVISGIEDADSDDGIVVFHAGTKIDGEQLLTNGGRVLNVTGFADSIQASIDKAYEGIGKISFEGAHHRTDIGQKAFHHLT